MKKIKLTLGSFKREGSPGSFAHYFSHILPDGKEVCLEACFNGYDVAIYDKKEGNLIGKKTCTDIQGMVDSQVAPGFSVLTGVAIGKAISIANKKVNELYKAKNESK